MKYNNIIFLGLCLGLTTYSALSADSVIKTSQEVPVSYVLRVIHSNSPGRRCHYHC